TLPSGIGLHTLRKQTRGNSVALMLSLRWGERDTTFARKGTGLIGPLMNEGWFNRSTRSWFGHQSRLAVPL
ncbi:hypothetical protein Q6294_29605, partial [Klebsiella pneumoniae]